MENLVFIGGVLLYLGIVIFVANQEDAAGQRAPVLRWMLLSIAGLTLSYGLLIVSLSQVNVPTVIEVNPAAAQVNLALAAGAALASTGLILSPRLRRGVRVLVGRGTYTPESSVHTAAMVLALMLLSVTVGNFVVGGGLEGLAQSYSAGVNPGELVFQQALWVLFALLGVGMFIRRNGGATLARLGLRLPTLRDVAVGTGMGLALFVLIIALGAVWALTVTPEQLEQQTAAAEQLAAAFSTLPMALLLATSVAVGEEIFFRGALQPVFGLGLTSLFFTLLHTQYTLTPATIAIFFVSLGMGWLRIRYSTTAAIVAHFIYDFIQLAPLLLMNASP